MWEARQLSNEGISNLADLVGYVPKSVADFLCAVIAVE
jgi:hypothetical protein